MTFEVDPALLSMRGNHRCPWIFFQGGGQKDPLEFRKISSGGGPGGPGGQQGVNRNLGEGGSSRGSF